MASLTKLRRRLLRWERYALRIGYRFGDRWQGCYADGGAFGNGLDRAAGRVFFEIGRREARAVYWPTTGMPPSAPFDDDFDDDRPGCSLLPGALSTCYCTGRPGCQSRRADDDLCEYCEDPACFGDCWGEEYGVDPWPPDVVTEYAFSDRGLL